tara:strand:+ start:49 stop:339 length:291 start_codon:yes stop_codon:yes gene_type:complete
MITVNLFANEIAIKWENKTETIMLYKKLRELCPCAFCSGEKDVLGNVYKGEKTIIKDDIKIIKYEFIGHYGLQFYWSDGHKDGIYTLELLKEFSTK